MEFAVCISHLHSRYLNNSFPRILTVGRCEIAREKKSRRNEFNCRCKKAKLSWGGSLVTAGDLMFNAITADPKFVHTPSTIVGNLLKSRQNEGNINIFRNISRNIFWFPRRRPYHENLFLVRLLRF